MIGGNSRDIFYAGPGGTGCCLTNSRITTLWLVFPVDSQKIHRHGCHHDGQTSTAHHRLGVEGKDQQEGPKQEVDHWPHQAHLEDEGSVL